MLLHYYYYHHQVLLYALPSTIVRGTRYPVPDTWYSLRGHARHLQVHTFFPTFFSLHFWREDCEPKKTTSKPTVQRKLSQNKQKLHDLSHQGWDRQWLSRVKGHHGRITTMKRDVGGAVAAACGPNISSCANEPKSHNFS